MTKLEKEALLQLSKRIRELASMKNAKFSSDDKKDLMIKDEVKYYMSWFECVAIEIAEVVENSDEKISWLKKDKLNDIIYRNL